MSDYDPNPLFEQAPERLRELRKANKMTADYSEKYTTPGERARDRTDAHDETKDDLVERCADAIPSGNLAVRAVRQAIVKAVLEAAGFFELQERCEKAEKDAAASYDALDILADRHDKAEHRAEKAERELKRTKANLAAVLQDEAEAERELGEALKERDEARQEVSRFRVFKTLEPTPTNFIRTIEAIEMLKKDRDEWKAKAELAEEAEENLRRINDAVTDGACRLQDREAAYGKVVEAAQKMRDAYIDAYQRMYPLGFPTAAGQFDRAMTALDAILLQAEPGSVKRGLESAAQVKTSASVTPEDDGMWIPEPSKEPVSFLPVSKLTAQEARDRGVFSADVLYAETQGPPYCMPVDKPEAPKPAESPEQAAERRHRELLQAIWECTRPNYDPDGKGYLGGVDYVEGVQRRARERR